MRRELDIGLTPLERFALALVVAVTLHGAVLASLSGMRNTEPRQPRIMVGMLIKAQEQKPVEPAVTAPPPAPETPPPEPPAPAPPEPPPPPKPKPQTKPVRAKPVVPKKPVPRVTKPIEKVRPRETAKPVVQTSPAVSATAESSPVEASKPLADTRPVKRRTPPRFQADYLHNPHPRYPVMSRKRREEGEVQLRVRVNAKGHPESVEIHASSGHPRLDQAARSAVREWQFVPAQEGGMNVAAWVVVPIQFNLER
jgi:protein TonB